jgi:hypothetical protein
MATMLVLGSPPSSSSATRAIAACISAFSERSDALPFGREALKRLGGVEHVKESAVNAADAFLIERCRFMIDVEETYHITYNQMKR